MLQPKRDVLVVYGGKSTEHDISRRSATHVLAHLDRNLYHVHAVAIDQGGYWIPQDIDSIMRTDKGSTPIIRSTISKSSVGIAENTPRNAFIQLAGLTHLDQNRLENLVVFPILHGTGGEDGTFQGFLQQAEIAFVGPDTLGSAIGIDKVVAKKLAVAAGIPVVPWVDVRTEEWQRLRSDIEKRILTELGLPLFVKPAQLGSSVGVSKVQEAKDLLNACELALRYDDRILIEKGLVVREIEVGMLGGYEPRASIPGEVIPHADFYSYDAKYIDAHGASMAIPAHLDPEKAALAQNLARKVFKALDLYGMARVDLFLEKSTGDFYFNEVNTIPGFTDISQYPLLWKESGLTPQALLTELIEAGIQRHQQKRNLQRSK